MNSNSRDFNNHAKNNSNFCSSAFTLNNPFRKSLLNDNWYFALTPFPKNSYGISLSNVAYDDMNHENELSNNRLLDVFYPFNDQRFDKIPTPRFSAHTFILIVELSITTKPFLSTLFQLLKEYFSQQRPIFFTVLIINGNSIQFPTIQKNSKNFSISTWSDFSVLFELQHESLYFNMSEIKSKESFQKYLDYIENIEIEQNYTTIDIFDILSSLFPFFKSLRNPIWIVSTNKYIHQYQSTKRVDDISQLFHQSSLNVDFYFLMTNDNSNNNNVIKSNPLLQSFTTKCNCSVNYFGTSQFDRISIDLIYNFLRPRSIFNRIDIFTSSSLEVDKIYGRGVRIDCEAYKPSMLTVNDTIHVFIKPNPKKLQSDAPKVVFRTRYVDGNTNCFLRYVPFNCSSRETVPEAVLTAAAVKIISENYDTNDAINELLQLDIRAGSAVDRKRYNFAVRSLALVKNDLWIANFVIGNCPKDVLEFLSPICCQVIKSDLNSNLADASIGEWKIVPEVRFGSALFLIWLFGNRFVFVKSASNVEELSNVEADMIISKIDQKGIFEIVDFKDFYENQQLVRIDYLSRHYLSCYQ